MKVALRLLASAAGLVAVLVLTLILFGLPVGPSLSLLYEGALGGKFALSRTAVKATPLLLTGLGIVIAWRARAFNIGGEGQFVIGGLLGAWAAKAALPALPPLAVTALILSASAVGGALWAGIAGWLHVRRGVEAVISTILLNFVAIQALGWAVNGPLQQVEHHLPQTDRLPSAVMLYRPDPQMDLNAGSLIALFCAGLLYVYLFWTKAGFKIRFAGESPSAARANRIDAGKAVFQAFLISGALCGLAGGVEYAGVAGLVGNGFNQNWGFLGIPVALLSGLHPLAAVLGAAYFGALIAGSENLGRFTHGGPTLVYVVQAAAVLAFVALGSLRGSAKAWPWRRFAWTR